MTFNFSHINFIPLNNKTTINNLENLRNKYIYYLDIKTVSIRLKC